MSSVTEQIPIQNTVGNGVTTAFPFAFSLQRPDDLIVRVNGAQLVLGVDYYLSIDPAGGGLVTFLAAPADGATVTMQRLTRLLREIDYQEGGPFLGDTVDRDFNRLWYALQDHGAVLDLMARLPPELFGLAPLTLPAPGAGKVLAWNAAGTALEARDPGSAVIADPADGSVTPPKLSPGGPSWNPDGDTTIGRALVVNGDTFLGGVLMTTMSPKFSTKTVAPFTSAGYILFTSTAHNVGGHFDGTDFTVPFSGCYRFDFEGSFEKRPGGFSAGARQQAILIRRPPGSPAEFLSNDFTYMQFDSEGLLIDGKPTLRLSAERYLNVGDKVCVTLPTASLDIQMQAGAIFSGRLVP